MGTLVERIRAQILEIGRGADETLSMLLKGNGANPPGLRRNAGSEELFARTLGRSSFWRLSEANATLAGNITLTEADHNKVFMVDTSSARQITLPAAQAGLVFTVKDATGSAQTNNITIVRAGSESIEGVAANYVIAVNRSCQRFWCDGTNWHVVAIKGTQATTSAQQTQSLWTWDAGIQDVDSISVTGGTNDLTWTKAFSATATWAARIPAAQVGNRFWELQWMFSQGISLQVTDGGGNIWVIVPRNNTSYETYVLCGGTVGVSNYTFKLQGLSGVGNVYDVYRNGVSQSNFSAFVTNSSINSNTCQAVLYGTRSDAFSMINNVSLLPALPKKRWVRFLSGDLFIAQQTNTDVFATQIRMTKGKMYRISVHANISVASTGFQMNFYNDSSATTSAVRLNQFWKTMTSGVQQAMDHVVDFQAKDTLNLSMRLAPSASIDNSLFTTSSDLTYMASEGRFWPRLIIEEL